MEYFKLNFENRFLWGIVVFIIFILGVYLIFLLPFDKKEIEKSERKIDKFFLKATKIFQFVAIFYFQYLLFLINIIKYSGWLVKFSGKKTYMVWIVIILAILFLIIIDYFAIKNKKIFKIISVKIVSFVILIIFILLLIINIKILMKLFG